MPPSLYSKHNLSARHQRYRAAKAVGVKARLRPEGHGLDASAGRAMMGGNRLD